MTIGRECDFIDYPKDKNGKQCHIDDILESRWNEGACITVCGIDNQGGVFHEHEIRDGVMTYMRVDSALMVHADVNPVRDMLKKFLSEYDEADDGAMGVTTDSVLDKYCLLFELKGSE